MRAPVGGHLWGGVSCLRLGPLCLGAFPRPAACPWGVRPGPVSRLLWVRGLWEWGPVTNPTACALARRLCALWGQHEGARGGGLLPWRGASGVGCSPTADCPSLGRAAGARYPLAVGAGAVGQGTCHQPLSARSCELALRAVGAARGRPGGGAPFAWVWGVRGGALSHTRLPLLGACGRGLLPTGWGAGCVDEGNRHQPLSTRSCVLALLAVAAPRGRPAGGASCLGVGRPGLGTLSRPTARPRRVRPGPATHWLWVQGVWAWGPVTYPTARALASWRCALWWRHEDAKGGRRLFPGYGAPGVRRSPMLDGLSLGRALGTHYPLAVVAVCGRWGPACLGTFSRAAVRALLRALPLLLGTCTCAVVVAGGLPLWGALWLRVGAPRLVWSSRSWCSGRLFCRRGAFPHPGGCRPRLYGAAAQGT